MKTLYFDCSMGAAGDMLTAALLEIHPDPAGFLRRFNALGLPGVETRCERVRQNGLLGSRVFVRVSGEEEAPDGGHQAHRHRRLPEVEAILNALPVSERARADALAVYRLIAAAESEAHGEPVELIHFHELGELDAIADVLAVCLLLEELAPERVLASPVELGGGFVRCAHGELPVPAPATALLLRGVPVTAGAEQSELCTPTGAALLRHFAASFGPLPALRPEKLGYGFGKKEFHRLNAVRVLWGETEDEAERLYELRCNLDDMSGEELAFAQERLLGAGALDVWTQAIGMKKGRPGVLLALLCREEQKDTLLRLLFAHTTTLGVRVLPCERYALSRSLEERETPFGPVRVKISEGFGVRREKAEYDDLARLARENGLALRDVTGRMNGAY